jgi:hypothetical protein
MIKTVKPIHIGPILLIGCGVILIIGAVIWQILQLQPRTFISKLQPGPVPTFAIPHTNTENRSLAYFEGKMVRLDAFDYSGKYLDFSSTHL